MPSSKKAQKKISSLIPSIFEGKIYELGSGWGNLAFPLAKAYPKNSIQAFEISPIPWIVSKIVHQFFRYANLSIFRRDFFKSNLTDASVIVCYLYPGAMTKLKEKFQRELKPGTLIVTNTFSIQGWIPKQMVEIGDVYRSKLYIYEMKSLLD